MYYLIIGVSKDFVELMRFRSTSLPNLPMADASDLDIN
jgi:hypothetical protein